MISSELNEQNLMDAQNYNRSTKYQNSTKPAIVYISCYTQYGLIRQNIKTKNE